MTHPRADIIKPVDNKLHAGNLEFFIDNAGIKSPIVFTCYEESLSALKQLSSSLLHDVRLQIGEKQAHRIITSIKESMARGLEIKFPDTFNFQEFITKLLEL